MGRNYVETLEKKIDFQWRLIKLIIYYCSNGGREDLPTDERIFLTAIIKGLVKILWGAEDHEISPYNFPQDWRDDIEEVLEKLADFAEREEVPINLYKLMVAIKKILDFESDIDQIGGRDYKNPMMATFKNVRDISGYCGKTFKVSQKIMLDVEKNVIPSMSSSNWSTPYFIKTMTEEAKKYFKKDIEEKSYIDRE